MDIEHAVAIVTGGASGLGAYIVAALKAAGAQVIVADPAADHPVRADITNPAGRAAVLAAADALGGAAVLVNNAGGWSTGGAQYPEADDWRTALELNLLAPMELTRLCLPALRRHHRGAVVNIASSAGVEQTAYGSPEYAAGKAGLIRFTTSLADWAPRFGVRVNCVVPGWVGLPRAREQRAAEPRADVPALVAPDAIADQVLRLVCDDTLAGRVVTMLDGDTVPVLL